MNEDTILIDDDRSAGREVTKLLSVSTLRKELRLSMKTRTKSSALINKREHIMPPTVCRSSILITFIHKHKHTHIHILQPFVSSFSFASRGCVQKCLGWLQRAHVKSPLSTCLSISFHSDVAATSSWWNARTSAEQRQPSSSPLYPASLLTSSLVCTGPAVILRSNVCVCSVRMRTSLQDT